MNKRYDLLAGKIIETIEFDESSSELTITFTDKTHLWIEITEFTDNSMLEVVLFDENDEIIETIQEGYRRS